MAIFDGDLKSMLSGMYQDDTEPAPKQMPMLEVKQSRWKYSGATPKLFPRSWKSLWKVENTLCQNMSQFDFS